MKKKQIKQYANIAIKYLAAFTIYFLNHTFSSHSKRKLKRAENKMGKEEI
jgi:hypothetical protein